MLTAVGALREAGAEVVGVAVIVDRGAGDAVRATGLDFRAAYTLAEGLRPDVAGKFGDSYPRIWGESMVGGGRME